jgi:hypothetical protein
MTAKFKESRNEKAYLLSKDYYDHHEFSQISMFETRCNSSYIKISRLEWNHDDYDYQIQSSFMINNSNHNFDRENIKHTQ